MPGYNDPQTLSVEGYTIYNAIHAPGAYTHNIINAKLAQMNSWMLENADLVAQWIHP